MAITDSKDYYINCAQCGKRFSLIVDQVRYSVLVNDKTLYYFCSVAHRKLFEIMPGKQLWDGKEPKLKSTKNSYYS